MDYPDWVERTAVLDILATRTVFRPIDQNMATAYYTGGEGAYYTSLAGCWGQIGDAGGLPTAYGQATGLPGRYQQ